MSSRGHSTSAAKPSGRCRRRGKPAWEGGLSGASLPCHNVGTTHSRPSVAATIAFGVGAAVSDMVLKLPVSFNPLLWVAGIGSGAACALAGGWLALSGALKRPPVATLREAV